MPGPPPPVYGSDLAPPPPVPEAPPPPPGDYTQFYTIWISDRVVPLITPIGLSLLFLLSFFPWYEIPTPLSRETMSLWTMAWGGVRIWWSIFFYDLLVILAWVFSIVSLLFNLKVIPTPGFIKGLGPFRPAIIGGMALLAFLLLAINYLGFNFMGENPSTIITKLGIRIHFVVVVAAALEFWLAWRRRGNYPLPRIDIHW
jgi:hypothetical protein